jgi:hypothetical protein
VGNPCVIANNAGLLSEVLSLKLGAIRRSCQPCFVQNLNVAQGGVQVVEVDSEEYLMKDFGGAEGNGC